MRIDPALARLRGGPVLQPRTDAALAIWRALPEVAAIAAAMPQFAAGAALADCPVLARLMSAPAAAQAVIAALVRPLTSALKAEPLAALPFGHTHSAGLARLRLFSEGGAALTLVVYAPRALSQPRTAVFDDGTSHELVVAGQGIALFHQRAGDRLTSTRIALAPGARLHRDGPASARQIVAVTRPLVVLQLTRIPAAPAPSCQVALADGRLLKTISGCKRTSQQVMALGVLGALGYQPAVAPMAQVARDRAADRDLRWEALRQSLALDAASGLAVLAALAEDPADPLAAPAAALQQQLRGARPDLAALLPEPA